MFKNLKVVVTAAVAIAAIGISAGTYLMAGAPAEAGVDKAVSESNVYRFEGGTLVDGGKAFLSRSKDSVTGTFDTSTLEPGNAYTMWFVIFNHPENCEHPVAGLATCSEGDVFAQPLGETPVEVSVQFAAGNVVGDTGMINLGGHLKEGEISDVPGQHVFGPGMLNANKAEVHLVVRDHGPIVEGKELSQITTFGGACTPDTDPTQSDDGPNACADVHFATFIPKN